MTPLIIQSFYARTPALFWPVLWWHVVKLSACLAALEEDHGGPLDVMIGLGAFGTLRIVSIAEYDDHGLHAAWAALPHLTQIDLLAARNPLTLPDYIWLNILMQRVSAAHAPLRAARRATPLHLEPG